MKLWGILLIAFVASSVAMPSEEKEAEELEKLPIEKFTEIAMQELRAMSAARILSDVKKPECYIDHAKKEVGCSIKMKWMKKDRKVGLSITFDSHRVSLKVRVLFDDKTVMGHTVTLGELCGPLPGMFKLINICANAYYVNINTKPRFNFDACFLIRLGGVFYLDLNCVSLDAQGQFTHNSKFKPQDKGIMTLSIEEGNLKFKLDNPIPESIMDKIGNETKEGIDRFVDKIEETFDSTKQKIKEELSEAKKDVEEIKNKVVDKIENTWSEAKDLFTDMFTFVNMEDLSELGMQYF